MSATATATALATFLFTAGSGDRLALALWHGPLNWCTAALGTEGFVMFEFEGKSATAAKRRILDRLDRACGPLSARQEALTDRELRLLAQAQRELDEYGAGQRTRFTLPLDFAWGTPFQQAVWRALYEVPYGEVISYAELAQRSGRPGAARAVGQANGANPLAPVVPCHRVIAADGTLGGYGGGLPLKARLLALEGIRL